MAKGRNRRKPRPYISKLPNQGHGNITERTKETTGRPGMSMGKRTMTPSRGYGSGKMATVRLMLLKRHGPTTWAPCLGYYGRRNHTIGWCERPLNKIRTNKRNRRGRLFTVWLFCVWIPTSGEIKQPPQGRNNKQTNIKFNVSPPIRAVGGRGGDPRERPNR